MTRRTRVLGAIAVLAGLALSLNAAAAMQAVDICNQVTTCRRNGGELCSRSNETCPPCIFTLQDSYSCWDKDNTTNTCPFTGVKYDCSTVWATTFKSSSVNTTTTTTLPSSSSNSTSTTTTTTTEGSTQSPVVMYAAIGGGVLVLVIVIIFVLRRRRSGRNMPKFAAGDSPAGPYETKRGAKTAAANTPYTNAPDTSKGPYSYQRKISDPVMLESSAVHVGAQNASDYSGNTASDSLDGMLMDNTPPPAVLGDPLPRTRSKRGMSRGFKRINSGGSSRHGSSMVAEKITHDVSTRCTNSANVLDEYLKMKQEMAFDADVVSDYGSDTMSLDRFSLASEATIGGGNGGRTMSITDSEYNAELMRSRTGSECFSEMSYNDEKYSFSEEEPEPMLSASVVRKLSKEVEI